MEANYIQINIFGSSLEVLKSCGIDLQATLENVGLENFSIGEVHLARKEDTVQDTSLSSYLSVSESREPIEHNSPNEIDRNFDTTMTLDNDYFEEPYENQKPLAEPFLQQLRTFHKTEPQLMDRFESRVYNFGKVPSGRFQRRETSSYQPQGLLEEQNYDVEDDVITNCTPTQKITPVKKSEKVKRKTPKSTENSLKEGVTPMKCQWPSCKTTINYRAKYGKSRFFDHVLLHSENEVIVCDKCQISFSTVRQLRYHYKKLHKESSLKGYGFKNLNIPDDVIVPLWNKCYPEMSPMKCGREKQ